MEPTLALGQEVHVRAGGEARAGDVALFADRRGGYVLHRLAFRIPWTAYYVHVGDAGRRGGPGVVRADELLGLAVDVPRRPTPLRYRVRASLQLARRLPGALARRVA